MANDRNNTSGKDLLIGALIGGVIGAAAALLWAPKAGYETRSDLNRRWVTVRDKTQEVGRSVRDRAKEVGQTVIDTTDAIGTEVKGWKDLRTEAAPDSASTDEAAADENAETEEKDGETDSTP